MSEAKELVAALRCLEDVGARVAARDRALRITGLRGAARGVTGAHLVRAHGERPVLFVAPNAKAADALAADLRAALGEPEEGGRVRFFPRHDTQPYERFSPQPFIVAQRMDVLYRWLANPVPRDGVAAASEAAPVVVAPWTALAARVPSRESLRSRSVHLEVGQTIDRDALVATLVSGGYTRMPLVEERGELAVRGGILDLFPPQRANPVRVELLGDEVESIREFDAASQRSQDALGYVVAPPPRELLLERSLVIDRSASIRELASEQGVAPRAVDELLNDLLRGHIPPGAEALAPLLQPRLETVFDFLPDDTWIVVDDPEAGRERLVRYASDALENFEVAQASGRVVSPPCDLMLNPEDLEAQVRVRHPVVLERLDVADALTGDDRISLHSRDSAELRQALTRSRTSEEALAPLVAQLERWREERRRIVLTCHSLSGAERLRTLLSDYGVVARAVHEPRPVWQWSDPGRVEIRVVSLSAGFTLSMDNLAVVTEEEIFGPRERRRRIARWPQGAAVEALSQLATGDFIVHAEHGIGVYRGLIELRLGGVSGEFLRLEYDGGDRLFVPVHRLNLIQRYAGSDGHAPKVEKLGGGGWEKAKRNTRKSLRNMAQELLSVHAARELTPGFAFSPRDRHLEEFEATFPFEETPDQLAAIEDVLADLQRPKPSDRIVCGDVGYGKTEVAVRAAFRAVMDGKQVAVLVPTTVLCQQHVETFSRRFEGHGVNIASLSRFRTAAEVKMVLAELASGKVDIVIGTHRLLQKNVRFHDLGLLVVDEEQHFGVAHKERIKSIKKTVDVLTLTATPIPRTLQLAFTGIRDLSVINTAPADRLSIRTQVCRFSDSLVREAILRELRRGGQIFFVHNRVQSINGMAQNLERIVPEAKVIVAHGQMRKHELEKRMIQFVHGEADVLLCTTIIESGLDIPRANTILINRADSLGLAQLYQLRGRVGRSSRRAYAYLLIPGDEEVLSEDARRRLEAIQDLTELGSGFRLANMDLEIRGAGNLLGAEQSGPLAAVGYDTYIELLDETMAELRGESRQVEIDPEIRLPVPALLPEEYVAAVNQRLVLYKRLASCRDDAEVERIRDELLDRFGPFPKEAENLLHVIRIKILARRLGIAAIDWVKGEIVLTAGESTKVDPKRLLNLLRQGGGGVRVAPNHKIYAPAPQRDDAEALFGATRQLLESLAG
jgi:transcription-repair coupling factor (superfamily II helicase)